MTEDHCVRVAPTIRWRRALDEVVLLDTESGQSWLLDTAGAAIWTALVDAGSVHAAVAELTDEIADPADVETVRDEVTVFLTALTERGTIVAGRAGD